MLRSVVTMLLVMASPPAPAVTTGVSIVPCQVAFRVAVDNPDHDAGALVTAVIEHYITTAHLSPADAEAQRMVCSVYFQGQHDLLVAASPAT